MNKELVISVDSDQTQIALLEDKQLVELHHETHTQHYVVGDIVCGKVSKIMQGLNAAFVDVGDEKDGFGHYIDFGKQYNSVAKYLRLAMNGDANMRTLKDFKIEQPLPKEGNLNDLMRVGQYVLVQIAKEPISTKGPKLTGDISIAGRYMVLEPFSNKVTISAKIKGGEERNRLRKLVQSIKPDNFGIIIRTVAEGKNVADLDADLRSLMDEWAKMTNALKTIHCPTRVHSEPSSTSALLRDVLTDEFNTIYVDKEPLYEEIREYLRTIAPHKVDIVRYYKMQTPIFEQFGIQRDIRRAFGKIVTIRSGVYLYIEHTEAMHVIDVNSGNHIKAGTGQEDTTLQVNIESAKEIARQLRLRDMGGIVVIDFVDMNKREHQKQLYDVMCEEMKKDKARHTVLPLSKFGLMQITRQRVRPVIEVNVQEKCPFCDGTGEIKSSLTVVDEIESNLRYLTQTQGERRFTLKAHPYVYAYLTKGFFRNLRTQWMRKYKIKLKVLSSEQLNLLDFKLFDAKGDEIMM